MKLGVFATPQLISVSREQLVLIWERSTNWHSLSILILKTTSYRDFMKIFSFMKQALGQTYLSLPHVGKKDNNAKRFNQKRKWESRAPCVYFISPPWHSQNTRPRFCHTILLYRLFLLLWQWRRMKDWPQRKECGSCCGLRGSWARVVVGVGCLAFHIGWPLGCMSQGLLWEEGELREK